MFITDAKYLRENKRFWERYVDKLTVGSQRHTDGWAVKRPCVNDTEKGDLLTPYLNHRGVEDGYIFSAFLDLFVNIVYYE